MLSNILVLIVLILIIIVHGRALWLHHIGDTWSFLKSGQRCCRSIHHQLFRLENLFRQKRPYNYWRYSCRVLTTWGTCAKANSESTITIWLVSRMLRFVKCLTSLTFLLVQVFLPRILLLWETALLFAEPGCRQGIFFENKSDVVGIQVDIIVHQTMLATLRYTVSLDDLCITITLLG